MMAEVAPGTVLHRRQTVPGFALPDTDGNIIRLRSFRQRRPVLIALLHGATCAECRAWLSKLAAACEDLAYHDVQPLLIFPDDTAPLLKLQQMLDFPGTLLSDPHRTVLTGYVSIDKSALHMPVLLVAMGRYNECLDAWVADEPTRWPSLDEIMAEFAFAEQEDCACGLPTWPED